MQYNGKIIMRDRVAIEGVSFTLATQLKEMQSQLSADIIDGRDLCAKNRLELLLTLSKCQQIVKNADKVMRGEGGIPLYFCNTWFLRDCLSDFMITDNESMLFISGIELANLKTLDRALKTQYSEQSRCFVAAESDSYRNILRQLDFNGNHLLAWFHSHPGIGAAAVNPSPIDMDHQKDLESGGYSVIGGIFARDGHIGFFSYSNNFEIEVIGKGVRKIDERLFQIAAPQSC